MTAAPALKTGALELVLEEPSLTRLLPAAPAPSAIAATVTPITLLQMALAQGADLDRLERLMALQREFEADEARKAFHAAMAEFKKNPPEILKNKHVSFDTQGGGNTSYDHASLDEVVDKVGAALAAYGLYHDWTVDQKDGRVIVTCTVTHEKGFGKSVSMEAAPDTSGKKNSIQAIASTVSYLQRYTLRAATGTAEKGMDNDGKDADGVEGMAEGDIVAWIAEIQRATKAEPAKRTYHSAVKACEGLQDRAAYDRIKKAYVSHLAFMKKAESEQ